MKHILALLVLTIGVFPALSQEPQITVAKNLESSGLDPVYIQEINLWQALQADDRDTFKANLLPTFLSVKDTLANRDQFVGSFKDCKVERLNLQNYATRPLGADAVVISYRFHLEMNCKKQTVIDDSNATTTWVRQKDNHWLAMLHTESPIKPTTP